MSHIEVEVRDEDFGGASDHIGFLEMPCSSFFASPTNAVAGWFKLQDRERLEAKAKANARARSVNALTGSDAKPSSTAQEEAEAAEMASGEVYLHFEFETAGTSFRGTLAPHGGVDGPVAATSDPVSEAAVSSVGTCCEQQ